MKVITTGVLPSIKEANNAWVHLVTNTAEIINEDIAKDIDNDIVKDIDEDIGDDY